MPQQDTLLFVCNNDSGVVPQIKNYSSGKVITHKENCNLSALTHSPIGLKKDWKRFMREQRSPSRILDRTEFCAEFGPVVTTFPVVLKKTGKSLAVLVSTEELNRCRELEDLISLLNQRLPPGPSVTSMM